MGKVCSCLHNRRQDIAGVLEDAIVQTLTGGENSPLELSKPAEITQVPLQGRKKSLLIGINYRNTENALSGCVNDTKRMLPVLESLGFLGGDDQRLLLDEEGIEPERLPTKGNMLFALRWLVEDLQPGDALFFHYSGHGGRQPSKSGGYNETLVPLDFQQVGMLWDIELFEYLIKRLPNGCRLTCLIDSCHSAGVLNLPYIFVGNEKELARSLAGDAVHMVMSKNWENDLYLFHDGKVQDLLQDVGSLGLDLWKKYQEYLSKKEGDGAGFQEDEKSSIGVAVGEVIAFSGCRSDQTSADVNDVSDAFHLQPVSAENPSLGSVLVNKNANEVAGGALTSAFVSLVSYFQEDKSSVLTYAELLEKMRDELASRGYSQVPQLASSLLVELRQPFALDTIFVPSDANAKSEEGAPQRLQGDNVASDPKSTEGAPQRLQGDNVASP